MKKTHGLDQLADIQHLGKYHADKLSGFPFLDSDKPALIISGFLDLYQRKTPKNFKKIGYAFDSS